MTCTQQVREQTEGTVKQKSQCRMTDNAHEHSPLVSVIIPVYKTPVEFISRCIQSVTAQTYSSLEIILIDDGSPASYAAEYQKIAQSDKRIGIIRRQNGGVSAARNDGIKAATGDWCLFVDADDWPEDNLCTDALNAVQKFYMQNGYHTDIVLFPYCKEYGKHTEKISYFKNDFTVNTVESCNTLRTQVLYLESTLGSVWAKLYRREFIKKSRVLFDTDLSLGEDIEFNFRLFEHLKSAVYIHKFNYHYRYDDITVSNAFNPLFADKAERFAQKLYADTLASISDNQSVLIPLTNARIIHSILGIALHFSFHRDNHRTENKKLHDFRKICERPVFKQAIEQARYSGFSYMRKIALFCLKKRFYRCIRFIACVRRIQYAVKSYRNIH